MGKIIIKGEELILSKHAKILSATVRPASEKNPFGQIEPGAIVRIASRIRHGGRTGSPSESSNNASTESGNSQAFDAIENTYLYEFSVYQGVESTAEQVSTDLTRLHVHDHQGCIALDTPEDREVEFSLLLMIANAPEWLRDDTFAHPSRPAYCAPDGRLIQFEALAIAATGRRGEYRRIGFAWINDRRFFVGTRDVEVYLV
jgi:hypothetical protein